MRREAVNDLFSIAERAVSTLKTRKRFTLSKSPKKLKRRENSAPPRLCVQEKDKMQAKYMQAALSSALLSEASLLHSCTPKKSPFISLKQTLKQKLLWKNVNFGKL
jgi:hypothetical protein